VQGSSNQAKVNFGVAVAANSGLNAI